MYSHSVKLQLHLTALFVLQVELIVNPSDEVIPKLHPEYGLERLDFVFMDHWKKCYAPDLQVKKSLSYILNKNLTLLRSLIYS